MTLLVLLVSVAVLEYVLRHSEPMPRQDRLAEKPGHAVPPESGPASLADSLGQLGQALDQFGRGPVPEHPQSQPHRTVKQPD